MAKTIDPGPEFFRLRRHYWCYQLVCAVVVFNFLLFGAIKSYLGGDAISGKVEDGRYYLRHARSAPGKQYTEVSKAVYDYSAVHETMVFLSLPVGAVALIGAVRLKAKLEAILRDTAQTERRLRRDTAPKKRRKR